MSQDNTVPPTEPIRSSASRDSATATKNPPVTRKKIGGQSLVPDLTKQQAVINKTAWYWIGALPGLPVEHCTIAGECFPKMEEKVIRTPNNETKRAPVVGALVALNSDKIKLLAERLPQTIVRFTEEPNAAVAGTGQGVEAVIGEQKRRKGFLITIPTEKEMAQYREAGLPTNRYDPRSFDEPVANYLFAILCHDQVRPSRGDHYPEPLSKTGIEWPGELS